MFWKVAGFSQPSPIEVCKRVDCNGSIAILQQGTHKSALLQQLLDGEDSLTLEQLLDEDDLIQECKSLNGRLIALWVHRLRARFTHCCT